MSKKLFCVLTAFTLLACCRNRVNYSAESNSVLGSPQIAPFTKAIAADTTKPGAWYNRGLQLHAIKEDSLALDDFLHAARLDTNKAEYASAIGDLLFEHKDVNGAAPWLARALRHNPDDPKAHLKMAKFMFFMRDSVNAFAEINGVLRRDAYNPEGYFLKGMIYKDMGNTRRAISSFQTALDVAPDYKDAAIQLAQLYLKDNNELGLQFYERAFRIDTTDVFPLYAKGMYFQQKDRMAEAKETYARCVTRDPHYSKAIFSIGFILLQQDSFEKARRQFDLVTKLQPMNAGAYYNRGLCSELIGDKKSAANDYQQALTFDPKYQKAKDGLKRVQ